MARQQRDDCHIVIPDTQVRPGTPTDHLEAAANYIVDKKPGVIVMLGDFADMHSLSTYDIGKKAGEGARYVEDIEAARAGMARFMAPIKAYNAARARSKQRQYTPRMVLTLGNHEDRIERHINAYPILDGHLSISDLGYHDHGWEVVPFLQKVIIDGVAYCHYFYRKTSGRPYASARAILINEHMSCTQGHIQLFDQAMSETGDGRIIRALRAGAFYMHDEEYKGRDGNNHWRGILMKNEVRDGQYDLCEVSLDYLLRNWL